MRRRCARAGSRIRAGSAALLVLLLAPLALAGAPTFPALTGWVVDDAGVLNESTGKELTEMLAAHERATGEQVVVVTLASLQGHTIEEYGYQLGRHWGIGQKDKNTGAMLIVAPNEHKVRIEVGYGLEGELTDAQSRVIIERDITPYFRRGDFNTGVLAGTTSILRVLGGGDVGAESSGPIDPNDLVSDWLILLALGLWIVMVIILDRLGSSDAIVRRMGRTLGRGDMYRIGYSAGGGYRGGGGYSGGGGGGGFSGGGGSFGGGGASGSW